MTGTKGNSEFCFTQNKLFPTWPVIKCYASQLKNCMLDAGWHTNLLLFQGVWPDHVWFESPSCCFPRELVSFFPPTHNRFSSNWKCIWVGRYSKSCLSWCSMNKYLSSLLEKRFCPRIGTNTDIYKPGKLDILASYMYQISQWQLDKSQILFEVFVGGLPPSGFLGSCFFFKLLP